MAFWADDAESLTELLVRSEAFLRDELALTIKPVPFINRVRHGMEFLGCRVFPYHAVLIAHGQEALWPAATGIG